MFRFFIRPLSDVEVFLLHLSLVVSTSLAGIAVFVTVVEILCR